MAGKTIKIYGLPIDVTATDVKEFLERYVEEGPVVAVKLRLPEVDDRSSRAFAVVQFSTSKHAGEISVLAEQLLLIYSSFTLSTRSAERDIVQKLRIPLFTLEVPMLHLGCPISSEEFSVLWSFDNVRVDFSHNLKKIYFFISSESQSYKLEVSHKNIWEIKLLRCHKDKKFGKEKKFLLIQVKAAPRIYEGPEQNSGTLYEDPRLNYFKDIPDHQWIRTTDFTPLCSIGQSSAFCLQLPNGCTLPNIGGHFVCYKEVDGPFHLPRGSSFSRSLDLVPIVEPPPGIELPYRILFKINHMVQNGTLMGPALDDEFYRLVSPCFKPIDHIERVLEDMSYLKSSCLNPATWLYENYQELQTTKRDMKSSMISLDSGLVYVHRVQVTPSKVYFYGPEINVSNRVIRHFSEEIDNFLRISFVDEDCEKMRSTDLSPRSGNEKRTTIYKRILSIMKNGICIGDKKFEFLAYSSSQLRENSAWMFASRPGLTAADVREWLGDFRKIRNVAKYAARLGQSFSSSTETLTVYRDEVEVIPDIENSAGYAFSDGIGKISPEFSRAVAKKCRIRTSTPSAFQIRYGGYKGVVAVDPSSSMMKLYLRKSMLKYDSGNNKLDVLAYSKYQPCYLNRQLITLLSTLGVPDAVFERKQREAVEQLDKMLVDPTDAREAIEIMAPGETTNILKEMLLCGYKPGSAPILSMLLEAFRATKLIELRTKSRIFIPKGRSLMGCLDETRTLNYGEVFVQVSCTGDKHIYDDGLSKSSGGQPDKHTVVEGTVIVAKNPCLHPGDMRVLQAVDVPHLHHMVDCVVFPQKGKRPHPNECSGSDLDGDIYFVSWDPLLIPPSQDEPMDYHPAKPVILDHDVTIEEVQEYFVNYMLNDSLGIISNAHTVFADKEPLKARSEECLQLARLFSMAVDFPKTGVPAVIPPKLHVKEYPDFMEKPDKVTYISKGVIGKLFREIKDRTPNLSQIEAFTREAAAQSYEATLFKDEYDMKLRNLMDQYDIKSKAQILSGSVRKASKSSYRYNDNEAIKLAVRHLRKEARGWFNEKRHDGASMTS